MKNSNGLFHRLLWNLNLHRWLIPIAISTLGIGYTFWETVLSDHQSITSEQAVMGFLLLGFIAPTLAFATMTWAIQGAQYWEDAQRTSERQRQQLTELNQELEARVAQRTAELEQAKEELAEKAQVLTQVLTAERQVEEKTRAQIAGDLHDGVQQLIVGALYEIQSALDAPPENRQAIPARLFAAQDLLRRIEMEMRSVIVSLHPVALDVQGLVPALRACAARFEHVSKVGCELEVGGVPRRYAPEVEVAAFRIAQEALHNAEVHAHAQRASMLLSFDSEILTLSVRDDGIGFDARSIKSDARAHLGLIGMRERAASVGGTLEIETRIGAGTRVTLQVPITESAERAELLTIK
jgi:signal transduction histidine kinase